MILKVGNLVMSDCKVGYYKNHTGLENRFLYAANKLLESDYTTTF